MKIDYDGRTWNLDIDQGISFKQARVLQKYTGLPLQKWQALLDEPAEGEDDDRDLLMLAGTLYWLMLAQNGEDVPIDDIEFDLVPFFDAFAAGMQAELAARGDKPEPDPDPDPTRRPAASQRSPAPRTRTASPNGSRKEPATARSGS